MPFNKLTPFVLICLLTSPTLCAESSTPFGIEDAQMSSLAMKTQAVEDKFDRTWAKIQALADAMLEENIEVLRLVESNTKAAYARVYDIPLKQIDVQGSLPVLQAKAIKIMVEENIRIIEFVKRAKIQKFSSALDDFLADNLNTLYENRASIEKMKKPDWKGYDGVRHEDAVDLSLEFKNILKFLNYVVNKLSPFQFGFFDCFKDYMDEFCKPKNLSKAIDLDMHNEALAKMFEGAQQRAMSCLNSKPQTLVERYLLNARVQEYLERELSTQQQLWIESVKAKHTIDNYERVARHKRVKIFARLFARMDVLFRKYERPEEIEKLKLQFPDVDGEKFINRFKPEQGPSTVDVSKQAEALGTQKKDKGKGVTKTKATLPVYSKEDNPLEEKKEKRVVSSSSLDVDLVPPPPEEKPKVMASPQLSSSEPKVTVLALRKQGRAEKEEQQRRAREWAQKVHADHLAEADLTTYRDLISDFAWMNDVINPQITMTYQSIFPKLSHLTIVKNGEGSRRHFIIFDTPVGQPIACYFHEPHPDEAVRIERWRESLAGALKKAGYYQVKKD